MDVVPIDAFAAFIILYTLFIVVVLPINSFVEPLVSLSLDHSDKLVGLLTLWITQIDSVALPLYSRLTNTFYTLVLLRIKP